MGTAKEPQPVKLVASLLTGDLDLLGGTKASLEALFGPTDFSSGHLPFDHTDYYEAEFGPNLQRQILTFERLIPPGALPGIKHQTNDLEWSLAEEGRRRLNIDPGYVSLNKLVLATTKDHAHRLYLGQGIHAEVTLSYQGGHFRAWPWTYPDYGSDRYRALFEEIRARYKAQLRDLAREPGA